MINNQKRLFLLDAYALIFRGYYAFIKNPRINSKGLDTSAIFGFINSLLEIIKKERPELLAVAFDKGKSSARVELFEDYKANRDQTPEAIKVAVPYIHHILKAMDIPVLELEGYEADDIIGTLAKKAEKEEYKVYMVTPDKDFAQLVSENIFMYKPARMGNGVEILGVQEVKEKFEIENPLQVIDFLGMMGDASDNIPGLPGVGEKTAKKFISTYGSMEALFENTHQLKGKMKEKVEANKELGLLSKKLATIILDVPIDFNKKSCELSEPDLEKIKHIFNELEFRRLADNFKKIFDAPSSQNKEEHHGEAIQLNLFEQGIKNSNEETQTDYKTNQNTPHIYQHVSDGMAFKLFLEKLSKQTQVCFDTETTSLDTKQAELVGIAFSWEAHKGYYISFDKNYQKLESLKPFFENENILKIGHNMKFDVKILNRYGLLVKGAFFDTMIAHYLINPDMRHKMDILSETYLNYSPISIESLIGKKGIHQKSIQEVSLENQTEYAVEDADITFQLKHIFHNQLTENKLDKLFNEIEIPLLSVLADMEQEGISLDTNILEKLALEFRKSILKLEAKIYKYAGEQFNISSPKQLGDILFNKMKISTTAKKTKTGQYKTSEEVLSYLKNEHPIIEDILEYRQHKKLLNTYVEALPKEISPNTKRVHTDFSQTVAATGRLSSNHPNLQNIPIRSEKGQFIRKAFVPRNEQFKILSADYSQIELRIIAALSGDEAMIKAFKNNEDIHTATAAKVFGIEVQQVTKQQRSHAKTVNFGIIYGVSAFGLSNQTNLSRSESKQLIDKYYKNYPKLKEYINAQIDFASKNGYVETILGRRRYLKDINSNNNVVKSAAQRNAVNAPIQGSAADIIKIAMINIHKKLKDYKSKMLLQVHDELIFDLHIDEQDEVKHIVKQEMENAYSLEVPLSVEMGVGNNWLEAH